MPRSRNGIEYSITYAHVYAVVWFVVVIESVDIGYICKAFPHKEDNVLLE